jgi:large subunit ribosomal protein L10
MTTTTPRPDKVAAVEEALAKFSSSSAVFVAEYRGLSVPAMSRLRRDVGQAGGECKVYKNTLATLAARQAGVDAIAPLLVGPTALTFVHGDVAAVAKALRDFSRTNPLLVLTGGVIGNSPLGPGDVAAMADLPSREVLLAQIAGAFQAPLVKTAGLLQALPRNMAYGLKALIDQRDAA